MGSFSGNSLSLTSVAYHDEGHESWSGQGNDTSSDIGTEMIAASDSANGSAGVSSHAGEAFIVAGTNSGNGNINGSDTVSADDSFSDSGSETWSINERT